ncbi:MAG: ABC transporter substrate-binding protein [Thermomicrobiales bacterium]
MNHEQNARGSVLSRRRMLGAMGAVTLLARPQGLLARQATPEATPNGGWSFTDDAGKTLELPERPLKIAADLNAASALWDFGIRPVAVAGYTVDTDAAWGNVDRDTPVINTAAGSSVPDLEKLLADDIDLFVTIYWGNEENPYQWSFPDSADYDRVNAAVPVIAISGSGRADHNAERFAELAASLGADLDSPEMQQAKADYEAAVAEFTKVVEEKADLSSVFMYADPTELYIAYPPIWADLAMYQGLGMNIVVPDTVPDGDYWEQLSLEQAGKYPSDLLFQSSRTGTLSLEELTTHPTIGKLPAVEAGQTYAWDQDFVQSYQGLAKSLAYFTGALQGAEKVTE